MRYFEKVGVSLSNQIKELFFDKVNNNYNTREDEELLTECFNTLYCDISGAIILLDSNGMFLASKSISQLGLTNHRFRYIEDVNDDIQSITERNNLIHIIKFTEIQTCPTFYVLVQPICDASVDIKSLGNSLQRIYMLANSYRIEYKTLLMYFNSIQEGISAINKEGILVYANDSCCSILDKPKESILNQRADKLCKNRPILMDVLRTKKNIIDSEYFLKYNDRVIHLTSSGYPVFDDKGDLQGVIDIFKSINRSRKLANSIAGKDAVFEFSNIIGSGNQIIATIELAKRCALHNENVLIEGESGTGKELFAQSIHNYSNRKKEPFIAINCANLPNELVESELFGYEEGTFTGAIKGGKAGKFELANGGTLFLDEIGELPIQLQSKLLRAVEYKKINRIGSTRSINVDVKIIAATNRSIETMIRQDNFREDLYYRLKVLYLRIPPLRERIEDIIELSNYFFEKIACKMGKGLEYIDDEAKEYLLSYNWPGNIRELENCIARTIFLCGANVITKEHLIKAGVIGTKISSKTTYSKNSIYNLTYTNVKEVYASVSSNKKKAAEILGISRPTLYKLLKNYNIQ